MRSACNSVYNLKAIKIFKIIWFLIICKLIGTGIGAKTSRSRFSMSNHPQLPIFFFLTHEAIYENYKLRRTWTLNLSIEVVKLETPSSIQYGAFICSGVQVEVVFKRSFGNLNHCFRFTTFKLSKYRLLQNSHERL